MSKAYPKRLTKEPLFDAVFELRFNSQIPASSILPGFLFSKLTGSSGIEKLPAAQLPEQIRMADPNLQFAPLVRFHWEAFLIMISDRSISIACKMPYPGWTKFKTGIINTLESLSEINIIDSVQRFSLKYVDLIPSNNIKEQVSMVNINLNVANHLLEKEVFQIRVEIPDGDIINVIQIVSSAEIINSDNGLKKSGIIVDIDTLKSISSTKLNDLIKSIPNDLEELHETNVKAFFDCLKPDTIAALGPIYE